MSTLFDSGYSPKTIRFYLAHWEELVTLADGAPSSRGLAEAMRREWERLESRRSERDRPLRERAVDCLCDMLAPGAEENRGAAPVVVDRRDHVGSWASRILGDLLHTADELPIGWRATSKVFASQGRLATWAARTTELQTQYQQYREEHVVIPAAVSGCNCLSAFRPQDLRPELKDSYGYVIREMAYALGWKSSTGKTKTS